jgi:hypothetical protein
MRMALLAFAELERGAAPPLGQAVVGNARAKRPAECGDKSPLLRLQCCLALAHARSRLANASSSSRSSKRKRLAGACAKGEHGTKVCFVKQLRVKERESEAEAERLVPMMREYTVFNVARSEGLPASIVDGKPARMRNPDTRDALADDFLRSIGADVREGLAVPITSTTSPSMKIHDWGERGRSPRDCGARLRRRRASTDQDQQAQAVRLFITDMLAVRARVTALRRLQRRFSNGVTTIATPFQSSGK